MVKSSMRAIVFDLSEVIIAGLLGVEHALAQTLNDTPENIYQATHSGGLYLFFAGKLTESEYIEDFIKKEGHQISIDKVKEIIRANFVPIPGMLEYLQELKSRGEDLYLLSVHGKEWAEYITEKYGLDNIFTKMYWSFDIGLLKPDPEAFKYALKDIGLNPNEVLFIDDSLENIESARNLGMQVHLFQGTTEVKRELKLK